MPRSLRGLLFLTMIVLIGVIVWQVRFNSEPGPVSATSGAEESIELDLPAASFELPPLDALSETVARPLFSPTRRPIETEATSTAAPQRRERARTNRFVLSAVIITDDQRVALLHDSASRSTSRVREGEGVAGWTVSEIREDGVTLTSGGQREELALRTFAAPPPVSTRRATQPRGTEMPQTAPASGAPDADVRRPRRPKRGPRQTSTEASGEPMPPVPGTGSRRLLPAPGTTSESQ